MGGSTVGAKVAGLRIGIPETRPDQSPGPSPQHALARTRDRHGLVSGCLALSYLQDLCRYWADDYDWRATEQRLNNLPQYRTTIDGVAVHFLHVRSPHPGALPLVITHGWPGSIIEFLKVVGPLTDPVAHGGDASRRVPRGVPRPPGLRF